MDIGCDLENVTAEKPIIFVAEIRVIPLSDTATTWNAWVDQRNVMMLYTMPMERKNETI